MVRPEDQLALWCRRGHEMTADNTRPGRSGEPLCRVCLREHLAAVRQWRREQRAREDEAG